MAMVPGGAGLATETSVPIARNSLTLGVELPPGAAGSKPMRPLRTVAPVHPNNTRPWWLLPDLVHNLVKADGYSHSPRAMALVLRKPR